MTIPLPLPVDAAPVACPRCGAMLDGPWVTFCHEGGHYAEAEPPRAEPTAWAKLPARPEEDIQAGIRGVLELQGFGTWTTSQKRASTVSEGIPDIIFAGHNVVGFVEVKRPGKDLEPKQQEFAAMWIGNGGLCFCWRDEAEAVAWCRMVRGEGA